jgi:hypothetical protein
MTFIDKTSRPLQKAVQENLHVKMLCIIVSKINYSLEFELLGK